MVPSDVGGGHQPGGEERVGVRIAHDRGEQQQADGRDDRRRHDEATLQREVGEVRRRLTPIPFRAVNSTPPTRNTKKHEVRSVPAMRVVV